MTKELLTINDASELSGIPSTTIREMINDGRLNGYKDKSINKVDKMEVLLSTNTTISLFNQKGGVGKTTSIILLADFFEKKGYKILLIDFDPQTNLAKSYFNHDTLANNKSLYDYFEFRTPLQKIIIKYNENIDIIPSSLKLNKKEGFDSTELVKKGSDFQKIFKKYQIVLLDTPPFFNWLSRLALLLCNYVLIPLQPDPYSYDGLYDALESIKVTTDFNKLFKGYKCFISMGEPRRAIIKEEMEKLFKTELKEDLLEGKIPRFVGAVERVRSMANIYDMYPNDSQVEKVNELIENINNYIFNDRKK